MKWGSIKRSWGTTANNDENWK